MSKNSRAKGGFVVNGHVRTITSDDLRDLRKCHWAAAHLYNAIEAHHGAKVAEKIFAEYGPDTDSKKQVKKNLALLNRYFRLVEEIVDAHHGAGVLEEVRAKLDLTTDVKEWRDLRSHEEWLIRKAKARAKAVKRIAEENEKVPPAKRSKGDDDPFTIKRQIDRLLNEVKQGDIMRGHVALVGYRPPAHLTVTATFSD